MGQELAPVRQEKAPVLAGGSVMAIVPQNLDEVWRMSTAIASAPGMAPRGMEKAEQIMVAIIAGSELGLPPFQSLQSFAVINGRPALWGDGLLAIVRRNGVKVREWHEGETAFCEITRPDTGEQVTRKFAQNDAVKAGLATKTGPWTQYPERMRQMRARAWAIRDGCADLLRGFQIREEVEDYQQIRDVTSKPSGSDLRARLTASSTDGARAGFSVSPDATSSVPSPNTDVQEGGGSQQGGDEPTNGDAGPQAFDEDGVEIALDTSLDGAGEGTVAAWVEVYRAAIAQAQDEDALKALRKAAFDGGQLKAVHDLDAKLQNDLDKEITKRTAALKKAPAAEDVDEFPGDVIARERGR